tara:strand:- start:129 stop:245 length:117 start_codon:yes stop_codon:yes gene_type:complete
MRKQDVVNWMFDNPVKTIMIALVIQALTAFLYAAYMQI